LFGCHANIFGSDNCDAACLWVDVCYGCVYMDVWMYGWMDVCMYICMMFRI
jgi:hypothetical protein